MKRGAKIAAAAVAVVGLVALASCMTTSIYWDGGFPSGEFRVNVRDPEGKPVKGAVLRVYRGSTRELASGYPLDNHITGQELVSDENGRITAPWKDGRMQFGGHAWQLFWVIPIGAKVPKYDCEISRRVQASQFPVRRLFESPHFCYEDFPKSKLEVDGEQVELKI